MMSSYMTILSCVYYNIVDRISLQVDEGRTRRRAVEELETYIRELYTGAKLSLFGSSCNGFGLKDSDMDICLAFESSKDGKDLNHKRILVKLSNHLRRHWDFEGIVAITRARVPILKFVHTLSGLQGDICLYNALAEHNTRLLKVYSDIDSRVKVLGCMLKRFVKVRDIGDASRGGLSSYACIVMALYYLQQCQPPVIPVLQELYEDDQTRPEVKVDGWNVWFYDDIGNLQNVWKDVGQNTQCVAQLWLGLFRFYARTFDFKHYVITIRQKKPLTKIQKMWTCKSIAIEDPFDLNHNLSSGVIAKAFARIRAVFCESSSYCSTSCRRLLDVPQESLVCCHCGEMHAPCGRKT